MIEKHNCDDNCIHKKITVSKVIDGETHNFLVHGECCKICGEILIHSDEVGLLEKRIKAYEELMLIVANYKNREKK